MLERPAAPLPGTVELRGDDLKSPIERSEGFSGGNRHEHSRETGPVEPGSATWVPAVDIHEFGDRFEFFVELPGVDPSKVNLTFEAGVLTLSAERRIEIATSVEIVLAR